MRFLLWLAFAPILAAAPVITGAPPSVDVNSPDSLIAIAGTGFVQNSVVNWAGTPLATTFLSGTLLTATLPAQATAISGKFAITVTNPDAVSNTIYGFVIPVLARIEPGIVAVGNPATTITVTGAGFIASTGLAIDVASGRIVLPTSYISPTSLTAVVPPSALTTPGYFNIYTLDTQDGFTSRPIPIVVSEPQITQLSPASVQAGGGGFDLHVYGAAFNSSTVVRWNGSALATGLYPADNSVSATVPASLIAAPGVIGITVANGSFESNKVNFTIAQGVAPIIGAISPDSVTAGGPALTLSVAGASFLPGSVVRWSGTPLTTTYVDSTALTAVVPPTLTATPGGAEITVLNPGGGISNVRAFRIVAVTPTIASLSPASIPAGSPSLTLKITGTGFVAGNTVVEFNGGATVVTVASATELTISVGGERLRVAGAVTVRVCVLTMCSAPSPFTITAAPPFLGALIPSSTTAGGPAFSLTISGGYFASGAVVEWNGSPLTTSFASAQQLTASVTAALIASPGFAAVAVRNPDGQRSSTMQYQVAAPVPQIFSLTPSAANPGGASFTLAVFGSGFLPGATVLWNSVALQTTYSSPRDLSAEVAAALIASPGSATITVVNPGGSASNAMTFTINPVPTIVACSPCPTAAGSPAFTLTLTGIGFIPGAEVRWNGTSLTTAFVSSRELRADVPAALVANPGPASLVVFQQGFSSAPFTFTVASRQVVITSLDPASTLVGGDAFQLSVHGSGFGNGSAVYWESEALQTTIQDSGSVTAPVPARLIATPGTAHISVVNVGSTSNIVTFTIAPRIPEITSLVPSAVNAGGPAFTLTVVGSGFLRNATVQWNGSTLSTAFVSPAQLSAEVPASVIAVSGSAGITVLNAGNGQSTPVVFAIRQADRAILSLIPSSASAGGTDFTLTVNGVGFVSGAVVRWNASPLPTVFVSSTQLTATVSSALLSGPGTAEITFVNPGEAASAPFAFVVTPATPVASGIDPSFVTAGSSSFTLAVSGSAFAENAAVLWNGAPLATTFGSPTRLTAVVPASLVANTGTAAVTVANGTVQSSALSFTIRPPAPVISSLTPQAAGAGSPGFALTVFGNYFTPSSVVKWNGADLATSFLTPSQLTAAVPATLLLAPGSASITVSTPGAVTVNAASFQIMGPALGALSPNSSLAGSPALTLVVSGAWFAPNASVQWNGEPLVTTFMNSTRIEAVVPAPLLAAAGTAFVTVSSGGAMSQAMSFPIARPGAAVDSVSPASVTAGGAAFRLEVSGRNFAAGSIIRWNESQVTTTFVSSTLLRGEIPQNLFASPGVATVTVVGPDNSTSLGVTLTVLAAKATIASMSPESATAGGAGFALLIRGSGFLDGAVGLWNGSPLSTAFLDEGHLSVAVPAGLIASRGTSEISVCNPGGTPSTSVSFPVTAPAPTITRLDPPSATAGGPSLTLTLYGSGFLPGAFLSWNGTALATTFGDYSRLTAQVPAALLHGEGSASILVTNTGGSASASTSFRITAPSGIISGLEPDQMTAGAPGVTVSAMGSGFAPESQMQWNGERLDTTYVDPTHLTARVTADRIANSGAAEISILNPDASTSAPVTFQIVALTVSGLDRSTVAAGGASFAMGISGTGFLPGATAYWNEDALATTFADSKTLIATVPASRIAAAGQAHIAVAIPGGALSNQRDFVVTTAGPGGPAISVAGVFNSAGGQPAIAPGSLFSIYGTGLAAGTAQADALPLPVSLGGTVVSIGGVRIPLLFVSSSQINAEVPMGIPPGTPTLVVETNGAASLPILLDVRATAPGVFTVASSDHAVAVNAADGKLNSASNPVKPGEYLTLYVTGQGAVDHAVPDGAASPSEPLSKPLAPVQATVGGQPATVAFAGLAPGLVGVLQINLLVPQVDPGERALTVVVGETQANATVVSIAAR